MTEASIPNPSTPAAAAAAGQRAARADAEWFWLIVGFSLLSMVIYYGHASDDGVGFELGIIMFAHREFASQQPIAFIIDAIALGFFALMGYYGNRGKAWAFYLGLFVYILDALICAWLREWWAVVFHAVGAYCIVMEILSWRLAATSTGPMTSNSPAFAAAEPTVSPAVRSGATWFLLISLMSVILVPSSTTYAGSVVGIGMAQMSDVIVPSSHVIAGLLKVTVYGFFCIMSYFANQGRLWAFILGLAVYLLDALIGVWFQDWWSVTFHAFAACFILRGVVAAWRAPVAAA